MCGVGTAATNLPFPKSIYNTLGHFRFSSITIVQLRLQFAKFNLVLGSKSNLDFGPRSIGKYHSLKEGLFRQTRLND